MATFITVEQDGSELLRRNQEQAQAARLAKLEGDEQARTEKEAKRQRQAELQRQGLDASGNALGDSRRRQVFRRDEPAATLLPLLTPGHFWQINSYINPVSDYNGLKAATFATANGSQSVRLPYLQTQSGNDKPQPGTFDYNLEFTTTVPSPDGFPLTLAWGYFFETGPSTISLGGSPQIRNQCQAIALPIKGDAFILAVMRNYSYFVVNGVRRSTRFTVEIPHFITDIKAYVLATFDPRFLMRSIDRSSIQEIKGAAVVNNVYVCNSQRIRELPIPAKMQQVLNHYNPPVVNQAVTLTGRPGVIDSDTMQPFTYSTTVPVTAWLEQLFADDGLKVYGNTIRATPEAYQIINAAVPFTDSANIKTFPATKGWLTADIRTGTYGELWTDYKGWDLRLAQGMISLSYGEWPVPGEEPDFYADPFTLKNLPRAKLSMSKTSQMNPDAGTSANTLLTVCWDWDDPNYCRSMCLALGFSIADLLP